LGAANWSLKKQSANGQHPHRAAGSHQGDIERCGGLQGQVLQCVVATHAQQTEQRKSPPVLPQATVAFQNPSGQGQQNEQSHSPAQKIEGDRRHQITDQTANDRIAWPTAKGAPSTTRQ
jgi:hypothetical protein